MAKILFAFLSSFLRALDVLWRPARVHAQSLSDWAEIAVLDHILSDGAMAEPTNIYMALCTTAPTDASIGATLVEATYTGYARKEVVAGDLSAAAAGAKTNSAVITFAACTAGSSTIVGFAIVDSSSGAGNVIMWGTTTSKVIDTSNTPPTIAASGFSVTLT